jgi:hypothetical protein
LWDRSCYVIQFSWNLQFCCFCLSNAEITLSLIHSFIVLFVQERKLSSIYLVHDLDTTF